MADRILLDTNILIYLAKNSEFATPYVDEIQGKLLAVSFATAGELMLNARKARHPEKVGTYWRERLRQTAIIYPDLEICQIWADITAHCHQRGRPRTDNDLWIAACALRHDLPLVSHNRKDFVDIPGLILVCHAP